MRVALRQTAAGWHESQQWLGSKLNPREQAQRFSHEAISGLVYIPVIMSGLYTRNPILKAWEFLSHAEEEVRLGAIVTLIGYGYEAGGIDTPQLNFGYDYHKPGDEVKKINFPLLVKRAHLVYYTGWDLANRDKRPAVDVKNDMPASR